MPLQEGHDFPQELLLMSRPDVAARRIADKPRVWNVLGVTYRSQVCRWCGENCTQECVGHDMPCCPEHKIRAESCGEQKLRAAWCRKRREVSRTGHVRRGNRQHECANPVGIADSHLHCRWRTRGCADHCRAFNPESIEKAHARGCLRGGRSISRHGCSQVPEPG